MASRFRASHAFLATLLIVSAGRRLTVANAEEVSSPREKYSITEGEAIEIPARKARFPLIIFGEEKGQAATFVASGYMGDASLINIKNASFSAPLAGEKPGTTSLEIEYRRQGKVGPAPIGPNGWVGVYWLTPANNWGKIKGAGYDLRKATKLTFWAKGRKGGETIAEVKVGGLTGPYGDTDIARIGPLRLTHDWKQYTIDLKGKDLRHIVGGFAFSLRRTDNPFGAVFYLDEIMFEGVPASPAVALSTATETPAPSAPPSVPAAPPVEVLKEPVRVIVSFRTARSALGPGNQAAIENLISLAAKYSTTKIVIEGNTDNVGPDETNRRLSLERARAVGDFLESKGLAADRISLVGNGADRAVASNATVAGRAKNRRVEITLSSAQ